MASGGRRSNSGRKRVEPAVKKLRGTDRKDRDGEAAAPTVTGSMVAPIHLSDNAQLLFAGLARILEQQGRASPHYVEIVALLSQRLEQVQIYSAALDCEGHTYESRTSTGGVMIRKRPEVQMLSDAMRHAHGLLGELMITPATALRLGEGQKPEDNPFAKLIEL